MRMHDLSALHRSTVGFDRLIGLLDQPARQDWPPYDVVRTGEDAYKVTFALAGYAPEDVEVTQHGTALRVHGKAAADAKEGQFLHRGISRRGFRLEFALAEHVEVRTADLVNGLLTVDLVREVPEAKRPRTIAIGAAKAVAPATPANDGTSAEAPRQAA